MNKSSEAESLNKLSGMQIKSIRRLLLKWGRSNFKDFPWRHTGKLWHALAAEVLLQRTRAASVVNVYQEFTRRYEEPSQLANASLDEIKKLLYPLGLPSRATLLRQLGEALAEKKGRPPSSYEELLKLPAIGPYAAAAYLSFHLHKRATIIDANVVRWICRLVNRECDGETRRKKWFIELADTLTPLKDVRDYNYSVLDFTMEICTVRPKCSICPIGPDYCCYGRKILSTQANQRVLDKSTSNSRAL